MLDSVAKRIAAKGGRGLLPAAEPRTDLRQASAQPLQKMINRFQRKRQAHGLHRGFDGGLSQALDQKLAQHRGADRVARQHVRQKNGERFSTTAATTAIRTKDPLATGQAAAVFGRVIPIEDAVPIQRFMLAAAWTALLFERKSSSFNFSGLETKRKGCDIGSFCCRNENSWSRFFDGTNGGTRFREVLEKGGTALTALCPH